MARFNSVRSKLVVLSLIGTIGMVVVLVFGLMSEYGNVATDREIKTRHLVESTHALIAHYQQQEAAGALTREQAQQAALAAVKSLRYDGREYFWVNDMNAVMLMHPLKPELDGKSVADFKDPDGKFLFREFVDVVRTQKAGFVHYQWPRPGAETPQPKLSYVKGFEPWGWIVGSGIYIDDLHHDFMALALRSGLLVAALAALAFLLAHLTGRSILKPLQAVEHTMDQVAMNHDLTRRAPVEGPLEIRNMAQSFNTMMSGFQGLVRDIGQSSQAVEAAARQLSAASSSVASASQDQSQSAMATSAAVEQMSGSIARVSDRARSTDNTASSAEQLAMQGADVVSRAVEEMQRIADSVQTSARFIETLGQQSQEISSIVNVIREISDQTNLLALNAAIEAARAGEQGRGFAVVADEVRKLAERTGQSTTEISTKISRIQEETQRAIDSMQEGSRRVGEGVDTARVAMDSMEQIRRGAIDVREAIRDISEALQEQSAASALVSGNIVSISSTATRNSGEVIAIADEASSLQRLAAAARCRSAGVVRPIQGVSGVPACALRRA